MTTKTKPVGATEAAAALEDARRMVRVAEGNLAALRDCAEQAEVVLEDRRHALQMGGGAGTTTGQG